MSQSVGKPTTLWALMKPFWDLTRALWGGTPTMRAATTAYLPQEPAESEDLYQVRLRRSVLTNVYKQTIQKLVGKPLRIPIALGDDVPARIANLRDDVDSLGNDIDVFSREVLEGAINDGLTHILVEYPQADPDRTLRDELDQKIRPYANHIKARNVIGWKSEVVGGKQVLTQVRISVTSHKQDPEDEFSEIPVQQIRVIEPNMQRVYEETESDDGEKRWVLVETIPVTLGFIPLVTLYTNRTGFMQGEPLLLDMGYLNIAHWQSDSDQRNILHVARVPLLFTSGITEDEDDEVELTLGPSRAVHGPMGSDMKYVEHTGRAIEAGRKDLEDLEQRMGLMGMDLITRRPGQVTATQRALDQTEMDSPLQSISRELENALETMLDYFAQWIGLGDDAGGSAEVFKDFGIDFRDAEDVKALLDMRAAGDISRNTFWDELKRRGLLNDSFDPEEEWDMLELETDRDLAGDNLETVNNVGDVTGPGPDGHVHVLEDGGITSAAGDPPHKHKWTLDHQMTTGGEDHEHTLSGGNGDNRTPEQTGEPDADTEDNE